MEKYLTLSWVDSLSKPFGPQILCRMRIFTSSLPFWYLLRLFLVWLLWLGLLILCWTEAMKVGIFVWFQILRGRLSALHHWVLHWLWVCHKCIFKLCWDTFPLYPLKMFLSNFIYLLFFLLLPPPLPPLISCPLKGLLNGFSSSITAIHGDVFKNTNRLFWVFVAMRAFL